MGIIVTQVPFDAADWFRESSVIMSSASRKCVLMKGSINIKFNFTSLVFVLRLKSSNCTLQISFPSELV